MRGTILAAAAIAACGLLSACDVSFNVGGNDTNTAAAAAQPATKRFVNSRDKATSDALRQHYVDFSFDYPGNWRETPEPTDGSAENYVRVAAPANHGYVPYAFHVGYAFASGNAAEDAAAFERALPDIARDFGRTFENYRVVSTGPEQVGRHATHGWRFTATGPAQNGEPAAQIFGRGDIIVPPGATRGVLVVSVATDRAEGMTGADQVGESGPLKAIFDSFELAGAEGAGAK